MPIKVNVSDQWKNVKKASAKVSDSWKRVKQAWVRVAGEWVELLTNFFSVSLVEDGAKFFSAIDSLGGGTVGINENVFIDDSGTMLYGIRRSPTTGDFVRQYALSTPWDISTASFVAELDVGSSQDGPYGLWFKPDGSKMFLLGTVPVEARTWNLSTDWDITTATSSSDAISLPSDSDVRGIVLNPTGDKLYIGGVDDSRLVQYALSTPWNLLTASEEFVCLASSNIGFGDNGRYLITQFSNYVRTAEMSTPWDLRTVKQIENQFVPNSVYYDTVQSFGSIDDNDSLDAFSAHGDGQYIFIGRGEEFIFKLKQKGIVGQNSLPIEDEFLTQNIPDGEVVDFSENGLTMFMVNFPDGIWSFDLSEPYNIEEIGDDSNDPDNSISWPTGSRGELIAYRVIESGAKLIALARDATTGESFLYECDLGTSNDITTAVYNGNSINVSNLASGAFFRGGFSISESKGCIFLARFTPADGVAKFIFGQNFDVTTLTFDQDIDLDRSYYPVGGEAIDYSSVDVSANGRFIVLGGNESKLAIEYELATPFDLTTLDFNTKKFKTFANFGESDASSDDPQQVRTVQAFTPCDNVFYVDQGRRIVMSGAASRVGVFNLIVP